MDERTGETAPVSSQIREHGPIKVAAWRLMMEKHQDFMRQFELGFRERHGLTLNEFDTLISCLPGEVVRHRDLLRSMVLSRSGLSRLLGKVDGELVLDCTELALMGAIRPIPPTQG